MACLKWVARRGRRTLKETLRAVFGHTRIVASGSYPLYRLVCAFGVLSAIISFSTRRLPTSFTSATDSSIVFGGMFLTMQLVGCLSVIVALYLHGDMEPDVNKVQWSLFIERFGIALLVPVLVAYTYGVILQNGGPPTDWATFGMLAFAIYLIIRFREIGKALDGIRSRAYGRDSEANGGGESE